MKNRYAITDGIIYTGAEILENHAVIINGKFVEKIVPQIEVENDMEKFSADGRLIVPGFVNAHHHFYSALATGLSVAPSDNFLEVLENLWWKLDKKLTLDEIRLSARWSVAQCVKNGVTTVFDHHASYGSITGSLNIIKDEIENAGIRGVICFEVSDRNGEEKALAAINENLNFSETEDVKKLFGLHAAFTISDKTFEKINEVAWENAGFHIHCAEGDIDEKSAGGKLIERLDKFSIIRENSLLVHGVHLSDGELKTVAQKKCALAHCPDSNMHNAVGNFNLINASKLGVNVVAGTDGMYSNMLRAYKTAYELSRSLAGSPKVGFDETFAMYKRTQGVQSTFFVDCNQQKMSIENSGAYRADFAVLDYRPHTPISIDNFWGHILYGAAENPVFGTIAGGKILYWENKLLYLDERKLCEECRDLTVRLI